MAFRELSEDEISLLNESERKQYEKQLKIYRERVAFVEKLEQIENANIQYTKPKLKRIKPVPKLDIPKYQSIGIVKIKLPKSETNRNLFLQQLENRSLSAVKIRKRMSESSAVCVRIKPMTKVTLPSLKPYHNMQKRIVSLSKPSLIIPSVSFSKKTKHLIHGISNCNKTIAVPQCKFTEMMPRKITGIPKKNIPEILPMNFEYEKKFTDAPQILIPLPKSVKFNFAGSVKIKDMPSLSKAEVSNKVFSAPKCEVKDILKINVSIPEITFEKQKHKIQNMPQVQIPAVNCDFSAIHRQISSTSLGKVQPFEKHMLSISSIKSYMKPKYKVALSPLKAVSIPSVNKFTPLSCRNVTAIAPQKIKEPCILAKPIKKVTIEKDKIPMVNINTPNCSEIDVKNILNIVHREL
ncbi:MAG: hypothetical protein NC485_00135 [Ruminococcus flavefaciens]|nr:hypothetical protein [Ruminococcus flavefaciens]